MQPDETLKLIKRLLDDPNASEPDCRAVAHLAYYGVYHVVCDQLRLDPWRGYVQCDHETIRLRLRNLDPTKSTAVLREAKRSIELLWQLRRRADYDFDNPFTAEDAERATERAEAVFSRVDTSAAISGPHATSAQAAPAAPSDQGTPANQLPKA